MLGLSSVPEIVGVRYVEWEMWCVTLRKRNGGFAGKLWRRALSRFLARAEYGLHHLLLYLPSSLFVGSPLEYNYCDCS